MSNEIMDESIIDCTGLACPQPVILTKKNLESRPNIITVKVDNFAAKENVAKFASACGYGVSVESKEKIYLIRLVRLKDSLIPQQSAVNESQALSAEADLPVYLITQKTLGHGSEELGAILMKALFVSLIESQPLPKTIMLLNSAVLLAVEGSPVLDLLQELTERGVKTMSCGTCLDYYDLKDKLAVGKITNMYSILEELTGSCRAITI